MGDVIISGGFNIYPREIEDALLCHPGVREAAVVGAPDAVRGEVPVAYLVADDTVDDEAVRERLRRELASFKLPRAFVRMDALPRTALGKVQRHLLPPLRSLSEPLRSIERLRSRRTLMRRLAVLAVAGLALAASTTLRAQIPEKFTNLQVLRRRRLAPRSCRS
jgi:hypothetical protein